MFLFKSAQVPWTFFFFFSSAVSKAERLICSLWCSSIHSSGCGQLKQFSRLQISSHSSFHYCFILLSLFILYINLSFSSTYLKQSYSWTRQSSYVNARGIPTAVYQVLHVLSCTGEGGYPGWVPPPRLGYPHNPDLARGVPQAGAPWLGHPHPDWPGGTPGGHPPGWGTPPPPIGVNWQTKWNYNLPSPTTYAVGN